jgi:hypothetical protein
MYIIKKNNGILTGNWRYFEFKNNILTEEIFWYDLIKFLVLGQREYIEKEELLEE